MICWFAVVSLAAAGCSGERPAPIESVRGGEAAPSRFPPEDGNGLNVLLLTIDTVRADHLGAYGYVPPTSPAIDALAGEGALFERAFAPRGVTWASLGTLMTSRYPVEHGVRSNGMMMPDSETTLAEILRAKGYECAALVSQNAVDQNWEGFGEKLRISDPSAPHYVADWLKGRRDRPFFLWVHLWGPHKPYTPPAEYAQRFSPDYDGPFGGEVEYTDAITLHQKELERDDLDHIVALYDALVARSDDLVGRMLETLESLDLDDNTLVVFASDHGEELYEHNKYFYHGTSVYDGVLHVPLIFRLPGVVPKGARVGGLVEVMDIAPTVLELLGFSAAPSFGGTSLAPFFRGDSVELGAAYSELEDRVLTVRTDRYRYVLNPTGFEPVWLSPRWHAGLKEAAFYEGFLESGVLDASVEQLEYPIEEVELYDVARDPLVMVDDIEDYGVDVVELNRLLQQWQADHGWSFLGGVEGEIDGDVQETLEALGYVF